MSYLEHIKRCNTFAVGDYLPFVIEGEQLGWAKRSFIEHIKVYDSVFEIDDASLTFCPELNTVEMRSQAIAPILLSLHQKGVIDSWVNEIYSISNFFSEPARLFMERAAVSYFGVRGYGVHINGLVQKSDGVYVWIARRTKNKPFWPGKLDQVVAGGQPAGISLMQNVIKESAEEAAIPDSIASKAELVSEIHYCGETSGDTSRGMNIDTLFNYDLWLPEDFIPHNTDGEVYEFMLMPLEKVAWLTDNTDEFKDNCNLVNIDLLLRLGFITKSHSDYSEITGRLYAPAKLI